MKIITVIDGDTVVAIDAAGRRLKLRLAQVDCPETGQPLADEAKNHVRALVQNQWVTVRLLGRDKYRRHVAALTVNGVNVANSLLKAGLGHPTPGYSNWYARMLSISAKLRNRGVHGLWFAKKPWQSKSRGKWAWLFRNRRKGRRQKYH